MKKVALFGLVFALFLFGCISTEIKHVQYPDGSADITQTTDMSGLINYLSSYYGSSYGSGYGDSLSQLNKLCDGYKSDVKCSYKNNILTLSKHYDAKDAFYTLEVSEGFLVKRYRLTVDTIEEIGKYAKKDTSASSSSYGSPYGSGSGSSYGSYGGYTDYLTSQKPVKLNSTEAKGVGKILEQAGVEYKYTIQMPGNIVSAEGAKTSGSIAEFDLIKQLVDRKSIVVVSEEFNLIAVLLAGLVILIVVLGIILMVMKRGQQSRGEV